MLGLSDQSERENGALRLSGVGISAENGGEEREREGEDK